MRLGNYLELLIARKFNLTWTRLRLKSQSLRLSQNYLTTLSIKSSIEASINSKFQIISLCLWHLTMVWWRLISFSIVLAQLLKLDTVKSCTSLLLLKSISQRKRWCTLKCYLTMSLISRKKGRSQRLLISCNHGLTFFPSSRWPANVMGNKPFNFKVDAIDATFTIKSTKWPEIKLYVNGINFNELPKFIE